MKDAGLTKGEKIRNSLWEGHATDWTFLIQVRYQKTLETTDPNDHLSKPGLLLEEFAKSRYAADVVLHLERSKFNVHSALLGAHSRYFRKILSLREPPLSISLTGLPLTLKGKVVKQRYYLFLCPLLYIIFRTGRMHRLHVCGIPDDLLDITSPTPSGFPHSGDPPDERQTGRLHASRG